MDETRKDLVCIKDELKMLDLPVAGSRSECEKRLAEGRLKLTTVTELTGQPRYIDCFDEVRGWDYTRLGEIFRDVAKALGIDEAHITTWVIGFTTVKMERDI